MLSILALLFSLCLVQIAINTIIIPRKNQDVFPRRPCLRGCSRCIVKKPPTLKRPKDVNTSSGRSYHLVSSCYIYITFPDPSLVSRPKDPQGLDSTPRQIGTESKTTSERLHTGSSSVLLRRQSRSRCVGTGCCSSSAGSVHSTGRETDGSLVSRFS